MPRLQPANTPKPTVNVVYDGRAGRERKHFADLSAAKRFYVGKLAKGKNPKIERARG